jgi:heme-degrading monooxygenase HmoA
MFARVSAYELPQERTADAVAAFRTAIADMEGLSGLLDAYMLVSEDGSSALTVTLWETHDAMTASRVRAARARSAAAEAADSAVQSTIEYRVAVQGRGSGTAGDSTTASLAAAVPPPS